MPSCFLYCRKSSEEVNKQVQSIESQRRIMMDIAQRNGLDIVETIVDEKSARTPNKRPGFAKLLKRVQKGEADVIVTWKTDRLSRNPLESGHICQLLQDGVIQRIITVEKTFTPSESQILFSLENAMASEYSRNLSMNVKRGQQTKLEKGVYPACAPIGYRNIGASKGDKNIEPDPDTFPVIKKLWDILRTQRPQLAELYRIMQKDYPVYHRKKPTVIAFSSFHRIFHNPFYCGIFQWGGKQYLGTHKPMITQTQFDAVQAHLNHKEKSREFILDFDFKGLFECGTCGAKITAERKNKFVKSFDEPRVYEYYKCAHHKRHIECNEKQVSKKMIEDKVLEELQKIYLPPEIIEIGKEYVEQELQKKQQTQSVVEDAFLKKIAQQKQKIFQLEENLCFEADQEIRSMMKDKLEELRIQLQRLQEDFKQEKKSPMEKLKRLRAELEVIKNAQEEFLDGGKTSRQKLVKYLGSNWKLQDRNLIYEPHFLPKAIQEAKDSLPPDFPRFETDYNSRRKKKLTSEEANLVWRRVLEFVSK